MESNAAPRVHNDSITLIALAQRWGLGALVSPTERALVQARNLHALAKRSAGALVPIHTQGDLRAFNERRAVGAPAVAGLLAVEGMHIDTIDDIDRLWVAGVRLFGVTHFFDTPIAGSAHGRGKHGVTEFGQRVLRRVAKLGGIVDVAHASPQTIDDVFDLSLGVPVIASHAGVQGVCPSVRNLRDSDIEMIAASGGVIGVGYFEPTVCGDNFLQSIADTIKHIVDRVGVQHAALGSDFDGAVKTVIGTDQLVLITQLLLDNGLADDDIALIMGGNVKRLLLSALPEREPIEVKQ